MLALGASTLCAAQTFPERPIQMVVPFGPGGTTDIMARLLADELGRQLGGSVVVVNTAGAGGSIGMGNVARAKPDGHTISMTTVGPLAIQPAHQLRPLVSLSDTPALGFENVPTAKQIGLPVRGTVWGGLVAPQRPARRSAQQARNGVRACHRQHALQGPRAGRQQPAGLSQRRELQSIRRRRV